ncbi:MAG TPA: hypothetical protein VMV97_07870 [Sulfuriferula sp.]|nr:hypothetical protein [Sulfuriferula sp.]
MRQTKRIEWLIGVVVWALLLYAIHHWLVLQTASVTRLQWSYGLGYALLAALVLAAVARLRVTTHTPVWRMLALLVSTALAALEIKLQGYPRQDFVMLLAAAVVGASAVTIIARYLPRKVLSRWFGIEEHV